MSKIRSRVVFRGVKNIRAASLLRLLVKPAARTDALEHGSASNGSLSKGAMNWMQDAPIGHLPTNHVQEALRNQISPDTARRFILLFDFKKRHRQQARPSRHAFLKNVS